VATINKIPVGWRGLNGLPGVTTFYSASVVLGTALVAIRTFFDDIKALHPVGLIWTIPASGVTIDTTSGQPNGTWVDNEADDEVAATGDGQFSAPSGWVANWHTGTFFGGREVRGKSFMVPLSSVFYDGQGNIDSEALTVMRSAVDELAGGDNIVIYSRKAGSSTSVMTGNVPDLAAVLKSRRD
jgi:hypothetical protein